jgi:hypothetical protein
LRHTPGIRLGVQFVVLLSVTTRWLKSMLSMIKPSPEMVVAAGGWLRLSPSYFNCRYASV